MNEERLDRHIREYVETELRNYRTYKKLIAEYEAEYSLKSCLDKDPSGRFAQNQKSDPTHNQAVQAMANEYRVKRMQDICKCIDDVLEGASEEEARIVEMLYFRGRYTDYGVIMELRIPRRSYYRHKRRIIRQFALRMRLV